MDITTLPRRVEFSLEEDLLKLEGTMYQFGLTLAMSKQYDGQYRELLYETVGKGGILAQCRLDGAPKLQIKLDKVKKSNVPLEQLPNVFEVDNVLYSIGMNAELFNSICRAYWLK